MCTQEWNWSCFTNYNNKKENWRKISGTIDKLSALPSVCVVTFFEISPTDVAVEDFQPIPVFTCNEISRSPGKVNRWNYTYRLLIIKSGWPISIARTSWKLMEFLTVSGLFTPCNVNWPLIVRAGNFGQWDPLTRVGHLQGRCLPLLCFPYNLSL